VYDGRYLFGHTGVRKRSVLPVRVSHWRRRRRRKRKRNDGV